MPFTKDFGFRYGGFVFSRTHTPIAYTCANVCVSTRVNADGLFSIKHATRNQRLHPFLRVIFICLSIIVFVSCARLNTISACTRKVCSTCLLDRIIRVALVFDEIYVGTLSCQRFFDCKFEYVPYALYL